MICLIQIVRQIIFRALMIVVICEKTKADRIELYIACVIPTLHRLAKQMGTSVRIIERHYSKLTPMLKAEILG